MAYSAARPVGRKVGLPHLFVPQTRIDDDRAGLELVALRGNRAMNVVNLGRHGREDALYDLLRDLFIANIAT